MLTNLHNKIKMLHRKYKDLSEILFVLLGLTGFVLVGIYYSLWFLFIYIICLTIYYSSGDEGVNGSMFFFFLVFLYCFIFGLFGVYQLATQDKYRKEIKTIYKVQYNSDTHIVIKKPNTNEDTKDEVIKNEILALKCIINRCKEIVEIRSVYNNPYNSIFDLNDRVTYEINYKKEK